MKVRCTVRSDLGGVGGVQNGAEYNVYGVALIRNEPSYVLVPFRDIREPRFLPCSYFAAAVGTLPPGLYLAVVDSPFENSFIVSGECFQDEYFFDAVTDGLPHALARWAQFQDSVDAWMRETEVKQETEEDEFG